MKKSAYYLAALAYALTLNLKGPAVEPPSKQKKPTPTERRKAKKRKQKR